MNILGDASEAGGVKVSKVNFVEFLTEYGLSSTRLQVSVDSRPCV